MHPPEIFGNKYVLRCILRHNCVLRQGILTSCALTSLRLDDFSDIVTYNYTVTVKITIIFSEGGEGGTSNPQIP